jgi:hypothetical protein
VVRIHLLRVSFFFRETCTCSTQLLLSLLSLLPALPALPALSQTPPCRHTAMQTPPNTQHATNTTQHNTTQHNTTQHNTTQHNTTQHNTTQHNTTQPQQKEREKSKPRARFQTRTAPCGARTHDLWLIRPILYRLS